MSPARRQADSRAEQLALSAVRCPLSVCLSLFDRSKPNTDRARAKAEADDIHQRAELVTFARKLIILINFLFTKPFGAVATRIRTRTPTRTTLPPALTAKPPPVSSPCGYGHRSETRRDEANVCDSVALCSLRWTERGVGRRTGVVEAVQLP